MSNWEDENYDNFLERGFITDELGLDSLLEESGIELPELGFEESVDRHRPPRPPAVSSEPFLPMFIRNLPSGSFSANPRPLPVEHTWDDIFAGYSPMDDLRRVSASGLIEDDSVFLPDVQPQPAVSLGPPPARPARIVPRCPFGSGSTGSIRSLYSSLGSDDSMFREVVDIPGAYPEPTDHVTFNVLQRPRASPQPSPPTSPVHTPAVPQSFVSASDSIVQSTLPSPHTSPVRPTAFSQPTPSPPTSPVRLVPMRQSIASPPTSPVRLIPMRQSTASPPASPVRIVQRRQSIVSPVHPSVTPISVPSPPTSPMIGLVEREIFSLPIDDLRQISLDDLMASEGFLLDLSASSDNLPSESGLPSVVLSVPQPAVFSSQDFIDISPIDDLRQLSLDDLIAEAGGFREDMDLSRGSIHSESGISTAVVPSVPQPAAFSGQDFIDSSPIDNFLQLSLDDVIAAAGGFREDMDLSRESAHSESGISTAVVPSVRPQPVALHSQAFLDSLPSDHLLIENMDMNQLIGDDMLNLSGDSIHSEPVYDYVIPALPPPPLPPSPPFATPAFTPGTSLPPAAAVPLPSPIIQTFETVGSPIVPTLATPVRADVVVERQVVIQSPLNVAEISASPSAEITKSPVNAPTPRRKPPSLQKKLPTPAFSRRTLSTPPGRPTTGSRAQPAPAIASKRIVAQPASAAVSRRSPAPGIAPIRAPFTAVRAAARFSAPLLSARPSRPQPPSTTRAPVGVAAIRATTVSAMAVIPAPPGSAIRRQLPAPGSAIGRGIPGRGIPGRGIPTAGRIPAPGGLRFARGIPRRN